MPIAATVTAGWVYATNDVVNASNINALGNPTVTIPDGVTYLGGVGSVGAPGFAFDTDVNTGISQISGPDTLAIVAGGSAPVQFTGTQSLFVGGSVSAPGITFVGDANCGFFHNVSDTIGVSCGNQNVATFSPTGLAVTALTVGGAPVLTSGISPTLATFYTDFFEGLAKSPFAATNANAATVTDGTTVIAGQATGIVRMSLGSSAAASTYIQSSVPFSIGNTLTWRLSSLNFSPLSNGTSRYYVLIGASALGGTEVTTGGSGDCAVFMYDDTVSAQWICFSRRTGTRTTTTTVVTVTATLSTANFSILTDTNGVYFYINGALVATHTTNYPFFTQPIYPFIKMVSTVGTPNSQIIDVDSFNMAYTVARP
jgi:hypothetical protein